MALVDSNIMRRRFYAKACGIPMCLFLTAGLLVSGCTSQYGAQKAKVNYYPQCYQPVNQLRQDENSTGESTAAGAVGANLERSRWRACHWQGQRRSYWCCCWRGAAGAVAGNVYGKSKSTRRDASYLHQYGQQLGSEAASMNRSTAAARLRPSATTSSSSWPPTSSRLVRFRALNFRIRYNEIRSGLETAGHPQRPYTMAKKDGEYQQALAEPYTTAQPATKPASSGSSGAAKFRVQPVRQKPLLPCGPCLAHA